MPLSVDNLVWGILAPLLLAATSRMMLAGLAERSVTGVPPRSSAASRRAVFAWETCLPYAVAVIVGYFMLNLGPLRPEAHYQWLPATISLATIAACVADAVGGRVTVRIGLHIVLYAATAVVAGYLLMPTWDDLSLPYPIYLTAWIAVVLLLALAIDLLGPAAEQGRQHEWPWTIVVLGTCLATAAVVAWSESLRFAQVAGLAFSASVGVMLAGLITRKALLPRLGLPVVVHLAGILLVAQVNSYSNVPWVSYLLPLIGLLLALVAGRLVPSTASASLQASVIILVAAISSTAAVILAASAG